MKSFLFFLSVILLFSCKKDSQVDPCAIDVNAELQEEINAVTNASNNYIKNATIGNCNIYKAALDDFDTAFEELSINTADCDTIQNGLINIKSIVGNIFASDIQDTLQVEIDALTAAATVYANDPTTVKCNSYKEAYQNYLNRLGELNTCIPKPELQAAIDQAQASLDAIEC